MSDTDKIIQAKTYKNKSKLVDKNMNPITDTNGKVVEVKPLTFRLIDNEER